MTIKLLHTADWQIGRGFTGFEPEDALALAQARLDVVSSIGQHATSGGFQAVLVAGDIFDTHAVSDRTIRRLFQALKSFDGPWVFIPGNHDAALADSVWIRAQQLNAIPGNAHVMLEPNILLLDHLQLAVLAAPLTQRHTSVDVTAWFDQANTLPDYYRVGLAHGSVQGLLAQEASANNPIAQQRTNSAKLDYLALGDWHGVFEVNSRCWYSGTPETDRFRNNQSGFILEVELPGVGAEPIITPVRTGKYTWEVWDTTINVAGDLSALIDRLANLDSHTVLSLLVAGSIDLQQHHILTDALGKADASLRGLRSDLSNLRVLPTADDIANLNADGYLADVLQDLINTAQADDSANKALVLLADIINEVRHAG